jgi:hypothetical protein
MNKNLTPIETSALLKVLEKRFHAHPHRHPNRDWKEIASTLEKNKNALWSIAQMEETGGEPDLVTFDENSKNLYYVDCSTETPKGRRSLCYDQEAWDSRKQHKPNSNVESEINQMGVELLSEEDYFQLQKFGPFDTKTSSWIETPKEIRKLGGALFGDQRFGRTFIYHNGAESYYAVRGFRAKVKI